MTENITLRQRRKLATRSRVIEAARKLFQSGDYHSITIRDIAKAADLSTGAIFVTFKGKEELFETAMGFPPPVDGPLTRAAPMLLVALKVLTRSVMPELCLSDGRSLAPVLSKQVVDWMVAADDAIALATYPLDGEVWARHLESIRRDVPHDCRAEQPAASQPSDAAGDQ